MSELDDLLAAQDGHFIWADAVRAGVPRRQINARVARGELAHVGRGAYVEPRRLKPEELHRRRTVAVLRTHPGRIATHHSAAILLDLPVHQARLDMVHFGRSDTSGRRGRHWVLHRLPEEIATVSVGTRGIAVPSVPPEVAAIQCVMLVGVRAGLVTMDAALRQMVRAELKPKTKRWVPPGRSTPAVDAAFETAFAAYARTPGIERARRAFAMGDARRESPAESLAAYDLDLLHIAVTPQWPITVGDTTFRVDFRVDGTNVVIEVDGEGKYDEPEERPREKAREQQLRALGYDVVRIVWADLGNLPKLRRLIEAAIARCAGADLLP